MHQHIRGLVHQIVVDRAECGARRHQQDLVFVGVEILLDSIDHQRVEVVVLFGAMGSFDEAEGSALVVHELGLEDGQHCGAHLRVS